MPDETYSSSRALTASRGQRLFRPPVPTTLPLDMAAREQIESFRELRGHLLRIASALGVKTFTTLVAPVAEGSGASFVARNLAAAFTLDERLALLVDCNARNPTQHEALGSHTLDDDGLFEFLDSSGRGSLERLIVPTAIPGLHLIPAGARDGGRRKREYFSSTAMKELMIRLRGEPCYVFLDAPPVHGSPDARILSDLADFVILVAGYGRSTNAAIASAAAVFDRDKVAGVVFNECVRRSSAKRTRSKRA
jgi:Mrp family chromosome partitioning ATPase